MLRSAAPLLGGLLAQRTPDVAEEGLELWALEVSEVDVTQLDLSVLDLDERHQAERVSPQNRGSYQAAHVLLRQLLGERIGVPPRDVAYIREPCPACGGPHGRPVLDLPRPSLHFSLSRSGDVALIGIATARLGVDVEALPKQETVAEVSTDLHPSERAEILSAAPSERALKFARLWTRKEAYLKGLGVGIAGGLAAEYVGANERAGGPAGWNVLEVAVPTGYAAAAAVARS